MGTGSLPRVENGWGVTLTPHPLLVPRYKKQSRAIPLLSLKVFVAYKKGETYTVTTASDSSEFYFVFSVAENIPN
jgi:hypothetical protein